MVIFKNCPSVLSLSLIHCHLSASSPNHNLISAVTITPTAVHQLQRLCRAINPTFCPPDRNLKLETVTWTNLIFRGSITTRGHESLFIIRLQQRARSKPLVSPHARHLLCWAWEHDIQATVTSKINLMTVQRVCVWPCRISLAPEVMSFIR